MAELTQAARDAIAAGAYTYVSETDLHLSLQVAMTKAGLSPVPEVRLTRGRIDFLLGGVGIEVKIKGSAKDVGRQLVRYAEDENITALLLVTTCRSHRVLMGFINGKPVDVLVIGNLT